MNMSVASILVLLVLGVHASRNVETSRVRQHRDLKEVNPHAPPPAELCAKEIVEETCLLLNAGGKSEDLVTKEAESDWEAHAKNWAPWGRIQAMSAADTTSMQGVWEALAMGDHDWHPDLVVRCSHICDAVIKYIDRTTGELPPSSDVGCYGSGAARKCDVNLNPKSMKSSLGSGDWRNFHDKDVIAKDAEDSYKSALDAIESGSTDFTVKKRTANFAYTIPQLMRRLSIMFRVWPDPNQSFLGDETSGSSFTEALRLQKPCGIPGLVTHPSGDGCVCPERAGYTYSPEAKKCVQIEATVVGPLPAGWEELKAGGKTYYGSLDGEVSQWERPTQPYIESGGSQGVQQPAPASRPAKRTGDWRADVQKRALEAEGDIAKAIRALNSANSRNLQSRWFGSASRETAQELLRILNSASHVIGNVKYKYPGGDCEGFPNTYAYVNQDGNEDGADGDAEPTNSKGQYIFYLCDEFFKVDETTQAKVLVHEASHHGVAYTSDLCLDEGRELNFQTISSKPFPKETHVADEYTLEPASSRKVFGMNMGRVKIIVQKVLQQGQLYVQVEDEDYECSNPYDIAYGDENCLRLAKISTQKALRNADNFCHFVQELTL